MTSEFILAGFFSAGSRVKARVRSSSVFDSADPGGCWQIACLKWQQPE